MEELIKKKIEQGIRGIKFGTKTPEEAKVGYFLNKLKEMDSPWYDEYLENYIKVSKMYNQKKNSMK